MSNDVALITGGLGFIGSTLANTLIKRKIVTKWILLDILVALLTL